MEGYISKTYTLLNKTNLRSLFFPTYKDPKITQEYKIIPLKYVCILVIY